MVIDTDGIEMGVEGPDLEELDVLVAADDGAGEALVVDEILDVVTFVDVLTEVMIALVEILGDDAALGRR